jgi:large subunit ribosomal protein L13
VETLSYKTISVNKKTASHNWYIIDAEDQIVGRMASKIANIIRGKNKPDFTPHVNGGDKVIVINAEKIRFTGKKMQDKEYIHYTGYPGGQRFITPAKMLVKKPTDVVTLAVRGMLPANKLRKQFLGNLYVYAGTEHNHDAQAPKKLDLTTIKR